MARANPRPSACSPVISPPPAAERLSTDLTSSTNPKRCANTSAIFRKTSRSTPRCGSRNISISAAGSGRWTAPADRQRIDYVVERCWLRNVRKRLIGHLSKGYRQRVGLADALLHNPAVLILDEPTVGLDPDADSRNTQADQRSGRQHTLLLSTHILPEVEAVCDRAIIIAGGQIVAQGSPEELRASRRLTARVLVECRGPAEQVKNALSRVSGVSKVEITECRRPVSRQVCHRRPAVQGRYDVREEVARTDHSERLAAARDSPGACDAGGIFRAGHREPGRRSRRAEGATHEPRTVIARREFSSYFTRPSPMSR